MLYVYLPLKCEGLQIEKAVAQETNAVWTERVPGALRGIFTCCVAIRVWDNPSAISINFK